MNGAIADLRRRLANTTAGFGEDTDALLREVEPLTPAELTALLPDLYSTGGVGAHREALRETINAILYRKVSESLVESIRSLDRSTERLTKVGWWITIVVGVATAVVSVVLAVR